MPRENWAVDSDGTGGPALLGPATAWTTGFGHLEALAAQIVRNRLVSVRYGVLQVVVLGLCRQPHPAVEAAGDRDGVLHAGIVLQLLRLFSGLNRSDLTLQCLYTVFRGTTGPCGTRLGPGLFPSCFLLCHEGILVLSRWISIIRQDFSDLGRRLSNGYRSLRRESHPQPVRIPIPGWTDRSMRQGWRSYSPAKRTLARAAAPSSAPPSGAMTACPRRRRRKAP